MFGFPLSPLDYPLFTPFPSPLSYRYEKHYAVPIGRKKGVKAAEKAAADKTAAEAEAPKKVSKHVQAKVAGRKALAPVDPKLDEQFTTGRLYGGLIVKKTEK